MIRARRDPDFEIETVVARRPATFELLLVGDTIGVFQLESPPMRQLLKAMAPNSFDDVAAVLALYRPGPMSVNMHYDFADRKNGRKPVEYFHDDAEGGARRHVWPDDLSGERDARGAEVRRVLAGRGRQPPQGDGQEGPGGDGQEREAFEDGCRTTGYGTELGKELFDIIEKFADYAFNKSHTFGYGLITYQTAYLKAHYPVEYIACLLTSVKNNLDKAAIYLSDCRSMGIKVLPPDVNRSVMNFGALSPTRCPTASRCRSAAPERSRSASRRCATSGRRWSSC